MKLGDLIVYLKADTTSLQRGLKTASTSMKTAGKQMQATGATMTAGLTAPIVAAGAAAFKLANSFESSMSKITGLVGVSREQVAAWSEEIIRLGPEVGKAPKELADALFFVTSAGIKGAEAMDVLTKSAMASAAGLGETEVVADLVTSAMNAYGSDVLGAAEATDILVAAVKEGKAPAAALASSMGRVLPIASEMGISFDQVGAAIAAMTRTGTEANEASTQLKSIMTSLLKPSQQATEALETMGLSASGLRKQIKNEGLLSALSTLRETTNQYGEEAMSKVFPNVRALSGVLDLMGKNAGDNAKVFESLRSATGSLNNAFKETQQTGAFKMEQTMASLKATLTSVGQEIQKAVLPIMQMLAEKLKAVGNWFRALDDNGKRTVIMIAGIVAAIGPVIAVLGTVISLVGTLGTVIAAVTSPVGLVIAAILALAAAVYYIWDNWAAVKERISDVDWWQNMIVSMYQFALEYNVFSLLIDGYNLLVSKLGGDPITNVFDNMAGALEGLKTETKEYQNALKPVGQMWDELKTKAGGFMNSQLGLTTTTQEATLANQEALLPMQSMGLAIASTTLSLDGYKMKVVETAEVTGEVFPMLTLQVQDFATEAAISVGQMVGDFITGANGMLSIGDLAKGVAGMLLGTMGDMATQLGIMAIQTGIGIEAIQIALASLNPAIAIAAGIALVALGSAVSTKAKSLAGGGGGEPTEMPSGLQGLATGGTVTSAGEFMVGEQGPERVNLPKGAAVTPNHMLGSSGNSGELVAVVSGSDLEFVLNRWAEDKNRIG